MVKEIIALIIMAFLYKLFRNRRKDAVPVNEERRKSDVAKRVKQTWEWHMKAIKDQLDAANEALKK